LILYFLATRISSKFTTQ